MPFNAKEILEKAKQNAKERKEETEEKNRNLSENNKSTVDILLKSYPKAYESNIQKKMGNILDMSFSEILKASKSAPKTIQRIDGIEIVSTNLLVKKDVDKTLAQDFVAQVQTIGKNIKVVLE